VGVPRRRLPQDLHLPQGLLHRYVFPPSVSCAPVRRITAPCGWYGTTLLSCARIDRICGTVPGWDIALRPIRRWIRSGNGGLRRGLASAAAAPYLFIFLNLNALSFRGDFIHSW
jgi:hypothetical protein